jgi:hypothetical protein
MKRTNILSAFLILVTLSLQSCFEIREKLELNSDGSGTFSLIIDMSEIKQMVDAFAEGDDNEAESPLANMEQEFRGTQEKLEEIQGISNVALISENDGYIVTTRFEFTSVDALNEAMNVVYEDENEYGKLTDYYTLKRRRFERTSAHNLLDQLKKELDSEEMDTEGLDMATLFADVAYVNEVQFNGRTVRKVSKEAVKVAEDGSSLSLTRYIFKEGEDLSMDYKAKLR